MSSTALPLLTDAFGLDRAIAWRRGQPVSAGRFLADVERASARMPARAHVLNLCSDRLAFATGFCAALVRGQVNVLPPDRTPETLDRLVERYPDLYCLTDDPSLRLQLPVVALPTRSGEGATVGAVPVIESAQVAAHVLTSGSTGLPSAHVKRWGELVGGSLSAARRHAEALGGDDLAGIAFVATVPPQHMFGLESSVLMGLCAGASFDAGRPFYPQDIVDALNRIDGERALVTTPFHLRALLDADLAVPHVRLLVCATAPLSPELAARAEAAFDAPLLEIYGCTEAGQVATRRPAHGVEWRTFEGLLITRPAPLADGTGYAVSGGHLDATVALGDVLDVEVGDATRFRLGGRGADVVNIAGKRTSLAHLAHQVQSIAGVEDGLFHEIAADRHGVERLIAIVVAPTLEAREILEALRARVDAVFLPRRIFKVEALPRSATGKLPLARVSELATRLLAEVGERGPA